MKGRLLFIFSMFVSLVALAQQNHFIYVQTDNRQPFYVKVNGKVISSSATGYAIVSKLSKGNYELHVGFPKKEWPEQVINLDVKGDAGYLLKNFQEKGWGLYNMQTMQVAMAGNKASETNTIARADVAMPEQTVNTTPVVSEAAVSVQPAKESVVSTASTSADKPIAVDSPRQADLVQKALSPVASTEVPASAEGTDIKKLYSINQPDGKAVVYIDNPKQYKDTVKIVLPQNGMPIKPTLIGVSDSVVKQEARSVDSRFLDIDMNATNPPSNDSGSFRIENTGVIKEESQTKKTPKPKKEKVEEPYVPITTEQSLDFPTNISASADSLRAAPRLNFNSDCKALASEDDFFKLRKKMAGQRNEENMTSESVKFFRLRCFSTDQIKLLAGLYVTEEGKYKFFDTAYPFISDPQNFPKLDVEFKEDYYINRFRAMIRK